MTPDTQIRHQEKPKQGKHTHAHIFGNAKQHLAEVGHVTPEETQACKKGNRYGNENVEQSGEFICKWAQIGLLV